MTNVAETPNREAVLDADGMDRGVGFLGLLWSSEGSLIGSGWLFGALGAAVIAGPSAIIAWVAASLIVVVLALVHAELGGLFPVTGGTSRFPYYAFGSFAGATFGWAAYLQAATVAPIEVLAAIQYLATAHWARHFYVSHATGPGTLSGGGVIAAVILMLIFVCLNLIGIRWLARVNNTLTTWKVAIPVLTIIILLVGHFHGSNFGHAGGGFFVKGHALKAILIAIPAGGIVFSLLGFEQAVQLGGEARDPKDVPRAVIVSILIGATVYVLLQIAFIGSLDPKLLISQHGWTNLGSSNSNPEVLKLNAGPFYELTKIAGLAWLAFILRLDAVISPSGTGLIYLTSSSRISFGLSRNGFLPSAFERTDRRKAPVIGIIVATVIGLLFLLPFPAWSELVNVVTSASVLMYAGAPLALAALRKQKPDLPRLYRLPFANVLAPASFAAASLIVFWAGWQTYTTLMVAMLIGYALIALTATFNLNPRRKSLDWEAAIWIVPYLIGMGIISYFGLGTGGEPGGIIGSVGVFKNVLVGGKDGLGVIGSLIATIGFSLIIYYLAIARRLPPAKVDEYVADVYPPPVAE